MPDSAAPTGRFIWGRRILAAAAWIAFVYRSALAGVLSHYLPESILHILTEVDSDLVLGASTILALILFGLEPVRRLCSCSSM